MYKKFIFISLAIILCFVSGCTNKNSVNKEIVEDNKLNIITTNFPPYDFVRQIGQDKVNVKMLLKPGEESHSYEPTPKDIKDIQNSDLFIYIGGENESWINDILNSMGDNKPDTLKLLETVPTVEEEIVEGMEDEHEEEHNHTEHNHTIDEHIWTSPKNAIIIVEEITKILKIKNSENTNFYDENANNYIKELNNLDLKFKEVVENGKRNTILFGDRFPFRYFADEYGLNYYAAFSGCSTETEASPKTVGFLIDKVKEENLPIVFTIEFSNGKIANSISEATGAKKVLLNSGHNITKEQFESGVTYLSLMKENVEILKEALN